MRLISFLTRKTQRSTRLIAGTLSIITLFIVTTVQRRHGELSSSLGSSVSRFRIRPLSASLTHSELLAARADFERVAAAVYPVDQSHYTWIADSRRAAQSLFRCMERGDCAQNQTKVVLISSSDYIVPLQGGHVGGGAVWALSTVRALLDIVSSMHIHSPPHSTGHFKRWDTPCCLRPPLRRQVGSTQFSTLWSKWSSPIRGRPPWKIFTSYFRQHSNNPLGPKWTLNPEDVSIHVILLGYSIEAQCSKHAFVPHAQRKRQAYILTRFLKFFLPEATAWPPRYFDDAANATGVSFVMAAKDLPDAPRLGPADLSTSIQNLGGDAMQTETFYDLLSHSVALVGIGNPALSPTAYDALCLGVPFINPINAWDEKDPQNREHWKTQHDALRTLSAPYVYHVFQDDREGFVNAIRAAAANPIQSYVLERMKMASVKDRLGRILAHDWKTEAAGLLKRRQEGLDKGDVFTL